METGSVDHSSITNGRDERRPPWTGGVLRGLVGGFALLVALIPTAASAANVPRLMAIAPPLVTDISPSQVPAGKETVLRLRGRSLRNGLAASFGTGIRTDPVSRASADGTQAFLRIRIAPGVQIGRRQLTLIVSGDRVAQNAYITVQAVQVNRSTFPRFSVKPKSAPAGIAPPVSILSLVTPSTVRVGDRVRLTLEGRNLMRGLRVDYGPGVRVESLRVLSATRAVASVRIDPTARPGRRAPHASEPDARVRVFARAALEILPAPAVRNHRAPLKSMGKIAPSGGFSPPVSILSLVTPSTVRVGDRVRLTLEGRNLMRGLRVDYGPGVRVESLRVLSATRAVASVRIDATARPGRRAPRAREPDARVRVLARAALEILAAPAVRNHRAPLKSVGRIAPSGGFAPPIMNARLFDVSPNRFEAGKDYRVTAYGRNLGSGLELRLGGGIRVNTVKVLDAHHAQVSLHVDAKARPGTRRARIRAGGRGTWTTQPATILIERPFLIVSMPKPKLHRPNLKITIKGRILLQGPKWFSGLTAKPALKNPITGKPMGPAEIVKVGIHVPTLKDDKVFIWREQNPGIAEWFEVRFYFGNRLITKRHVGLNRKGVLPTWLEPDPALITTLARAASTYGVSVSRDAKTGRIKVSGVVQATPVWGGRKRVLPASDITWEVVGYRRYFKSGIERHAAMKARRPIMLASLSGKFVPSNDNLGTMVPRAVERSERWPLNTPYHPTGLACGNEASGKFNVRPIDSGSTSKGKPFSTKITPAAHTGDRWQLFGTMDLSRSPWSSEPSETSTAVGHGKNKHFPSITWNFDNIYLDWGDGTVVPLAISKSVVPGRSVNLFDNHHSKLDLANNDITPHRHTYSRVGSYTVRIYQLAEGDIQNESAGNVSMAANPRATLYSAARMAIGGGDSRPDDNTAPRSFHHARAVGKRAYMVLCKQVVIKARHDPASDGPLNLVAAKVRGFPEQAGDDTPPKGVSVAPPLDAIKSLIPKAASGGGSPVARSSFSVRHLQVDRSAVHPGLPSRGMTQVFHAKGHSEPSFSACDVALTGGGNLYYYGQGQVRTTWYVDGAPVDNSILSLGPSTPRSDHVLAGKHPGKPLVSASDLILSPSIPFDKLGRHRLSFDAEVIYDVSGLTNLSALMGQALGAGDRKPDRRLAAQLAAGLHGAPRLGVLPPRGVRFSGTGDPVVWLSRPLQHLAQRSPKPVQLAALDRVMFDSGAPIRIGGILHSAQVLPKGKPPAYVAAPARAYRVLGFDSTQPCTFRFPVQGGEFIVGGLQGPGRGKPNVTRQGNKWSGHGKLFIKLAGANGGMLQLPVPLKFKGWTLKDDAVTVSSGAFDLPEPIQSRLSMSGVGVRVQRLRGEAGKSVRMTLTAWISNSNIVATATQAKPSPLTATAVLSPKGDWYADGLTLPKIDVYDSGFTLTPKSVALDFSASRGSGCGSSKGWMGLTFGKGSQLSAYTFELRKGQTAAVSGWGIDGQGLCGAANFGPYDAQVERGSIHWESIEANATGGGFRARYNGLRVHVPWLDTDLTSSGSQLLSAGKGSNGGKLVLNLTGDAPPRNFGPVTLNANALQFGTLKGVGPAVRAQSTLFSFRADGRTFAKDVAVPDLVFGMNGKAYFKEGGGAAHISLSGAKGRLSQGVVDLKGMDVIATPGKSSRLLFNFSTELRISDALPAAPAPVSYRIDEASAAKYTGSGPVTGKFVIHKPFPDANPSTDSVIHADYVGPQGGHGAASAGHMSYCGKIDLGMFGGPPVKGGFALGYQGSDDFWAAGADVSMGPAGAPLVPPFMTLYTVGGGLGYNVALNSFTSGASCNVSANIDHTPAFNAHIQVGDPTHFVYGFDGRFTVKVSGPEAGARMDYKAWMVSKKWDGPGNFHGHFLFANGNFDGTLNGKYGFLDDKVYIEAANDAISMHFGGGRWYIHAGTQSNPVKGHVLIVNAGAWLGLGSGGMYAGAKAHLNLGVGNCDAACARVIVDMMIAAAITPQPHISADANMHMDAHACALKICLGAGVGASMHVAALPPELSIGFRLGGCPPGHLDIGLRILPSPKPNIGGGLCLW